MTTFDSAGHRHLTPVDHHMQQRAARLQQLGLGGKPDPELDAFAEYVAKTAGVPNAMVNFIGDTQQFAAGLYSGIIAPDTSDDSALRSAPLETGYCPHVIARRKALVLDDVFAYPRFAGNDVVDRMGVRSYLGAPLIDRTDTALGTICVVDSEPRPWGREGLHMIKNIAAELVDLVHRRERDAR
ncbi:GAF domain-containing protein, partial [Saccharopolyspora taberi]|uniref:GAF domain-containing protein n=1 Tax=Saccharopolyspora taberi TaxID=60895 RepID=UPI0031E1AA27